ncbi:unnamed protein product, partial [Owenia fusiformis]
SYEPSVTNFYFYEIAIWSWHLLIKALKFLAYQIFEFLWHMFILLQAEDAPDEDRVYKRVAVVEDFFDIIYSVHVEMEGRSGKHAGQKRTYKAVSRRTVMFGPHCLVTSHT